MLVYRTYLAGFVGRTRFLRVFTFLAPFILADPLVVRKIVILWRYTMLRYPRIVGPGVHHDNGSFRGETWTVRRESAARGGHRPRLVHKLRQGGASYRRAESDVGSGQREAVEGETVWYHFHLFMAASLLMYCRREETSRFYGSLYK